MYSGKLIYAANWNKYNRVGFWDELDYVGIEAYFPLAKDGDPEFEEIKAGWLEWADKIQAWQERINKPVIFTEIGYRSCEFAAVKPWEYGSNQRINLGLQADCYEAALSTLHNRPWCQGMYWWHWETSAYERDPHNDSFTPQNKPAEKVLRYWYSGPYLVSLPDTLSY